MAIEGEWAAAWRKPGHTVMKDHASHLDHTQDSLGIWSVLHVHEGTGVMKWGG